MIRLLILALILISSAHAQPAQTTRTANGFTFTLQKAPLYSVVSTIYGEVLKEPFLLDEAVKDNPVTINFKNADPQILRSVLDDYLAVKGIRRVVRGGLNMFVPAERMTDSQSSSFSSSSSSQVTRSSSFQQYDQAQKPQSPQIHFVYRSQHRPAVELLKLASALAPSSQLIGDDILLVGDSAKVDIAQRLLSQYDISRGEITVKATLVEYTYSKDDGAGLYGAFKLLGGKLNVNFGDSKSAANLVSFKNSTIETVLSAVAQDSKFSVIDTSTLRVISGKTAVLSAGQEVPVLAGVSLDSKGNPVQNITYRSGGLLFKVTPTTAGERVQAEVFQSLSSFAVTRTSNIDSPTQTKREFTSYLSADFGEVILLGGLDEDRNSTAANGLFGIKFGSNKAASKSTLFLVLQFLKA
jgi:general secretion pathway protein D